MSEKKYKRVGGYNFYHAFAISFFVLMVVNSLTNPLVESTNDYSVFCFLLLGEIRYYINSKFYKEEK